MNKKDLVVVALATFCLTSTLFMILPSRSVERDPWADVSGPTQGVPDGTINMRDINWEIQHFNQDVSNMTRDVNVTNWPSTVNPKDSIFTWSSGVQYIAPPPGIYYQSSWSSDYLSTVGFKQVTINVIANCSVRVTVMQTLQFDQQEIANWFTKTYDVKGTDILIQVDNLALERGVGNSTAEVFCFVYMTSIPSLQSQPSYDEQTLYVNASQGASWYIMRNNFECNGYSRLGVSISPGYPLMNGTYDITLYLYGIEWGGSGGSSWEPLPPSALNVTFVVNNGVLSYNRPSPFITETKSRHCSLIWMVLASHNLPPDWWMPFYVGAYMRNE